MFLILGFVFSGSAIADQPLPCKYGEADGFAASTWVRPQIGQNGWYGRYNVIQFCEAKTPGNYVLIQEELIKNFKVVNPPRVIIDVETGSDGIVYRLADELDKEVTLTVSPNGQSLKVNAKLFGREEEATLERLQP
jgi:hypothetical protein